MPIWKIEGYDTYAREPYALDGKFSSQAAAERAACKRLKKLELSQPRARSGGQEGIQDQVYIIQPDGMRDRYKPSVPIRVGLLCRIACKLGW